MSDQDQYPTTELTAQDFGFLLAGAIAAVYRHGQRINWQDAFIDQDLDELLAAAQVLARLPGVQEHIVADTQIVADLANVYRQLLEDDAPDFEQISFATRRLWRAVKPFS